MTRRRLGVHRPTPLTIEGGILSMASISLRHNEVVLNPDEEWRPIPGREDYEVSNYGKIRRLTAKRGTRAGRPLKPYFMNRIWFCTTTLNGRNQHIGVGRAVLLAFVGPPPSPDHQTLHGDGNPRNNHVSNLRWGTAQENADDRIRHGNGSQGEANWTAKLTTRKVLAIRAAAASGETYHSLAKQYGVRHGTISGICNRRSWKHLP